MSYMFSSSLHFYSENIFKKACVYIRGLHVTLLGVVCISHRIFWCLHILLLGYDGGCMRSGSNLESVFSLFHLARRLYTLLLLLRWNIDVVWKAILRKRMCVEYHHTVIRTSKKKGNQDSLLGWRWTNHEIEIIFLFK